MKATVLVNSGSLLVGAAVVVLTFLQGRELGAMKAEAETLRTRPTASATAPAPLAAPSSVEVLAEAEKHELLRLRAEVTRLRQRQRELAGEKAENENLRAAALKRQANGTGSPNDIPPGYMRRRDARFVGAASPEAALQSFFWALENRDINALIQLVDKSTAREFQQVIDNAGVEKFWGEVGKVPGFRVANSEALDGSTVKLQVQFMPYDETADIIARQSGNTWRLRTGY